MESVVVSVCWVVVSSVLSVGMQSESVVFVKVLGQMHMVTLWRDATHFTAPEQKV